MVVAGASVAECRMDSVRFLAVFIGFAWMFYKGTGLNCHICDPSKSWDECNEKSSQYKCPEKMQVCYKTHSVEFNNDEEVHRYRKGCGTEVFCTGQECKEKGTWCDVQCCNTDACNESTVWNANCRTFIVLALLTAVLLL
ncbi:uncharacterized protein LOC113685065 isoform X2 [Pocillopora damicornis]|uniref:uncharacterized protein LOC113685065 isoform X2 n=2 Tax=Pocillopora damicornis TaxID=46731 RepID=UPI000F552EC3|nr:uncharacterized protein LOC113685065 isoform X2 [Pocillopora damicornis]XP_058972076.1 uncharacterized protein LOC131798447 isoform X1 [Pocillopora verrucosa]